MNTLFAICVIAVAFTLSIGCAIPMKPHEIEAYAGNMASMEKWIAKSSTLAQFEEEVGESQKPTFYTDIKFKRFTPAKSVDLLSMRSVRRKSNHEVVIHGAARTMSGEGMQYWIVIDEAVKSK